MSIADFLFDFHRWAASCGSSSSVLWIKARRTPPTTWLWCWYWLRRGWRSWKWSGWLGIEIVKIFPFFLSKLESEYWCLSAESHGQIQEDVKIWVELGEGNTCNEPREIFEMTQHPNGLHSTHTQQYTQNTQHPNTHSTQYTQNTRHPIGLNILKSHTAPKWTEYWEEELYNVQSVLCSIHREVYVKREEEEQLCNVQVVQSF